MAKKTSPTGRTRMGWPQLQQIPKLSTEEARRLRDAFRERFPEPMAAWNHLTQPWTGESQDGSVVGFDPGEGDLPAFTVMRKEPDGSVTVLECHKGEAALRAADEWHNKPETEQ